MFILIYSSTVSLVFCLLLIVLFFSALLVPVAQREESKIANPPVPVHSFKCPLDIYPAEALIHPANVTVVFLKTLEKYGFLVSFSLLAKKKATS